MFYYLRGKLAVKKPGFAVLDVNGVGYELLIPLSTYGKLPDCGEEFQFLTCFHVREDAQQIFGFASEEEKELFRLLISVNGIGPKLGLTVLSGLEIEALRRAIIHEDLAALSAVPGIGKKTAERIVIELREKVMLSEKGRAVDPLSGAKTAVSDPLFEDTLQVLLSLGYKKPQAQDAIKKTVSENAGHLNTVEELVRQTLKRI